LRNYICVGGDPEHWAFLDNFCWCDPVASDKNPDGEYKLAQLVRANKALYDYALAYRCPMISGKDSMKNDYIGAGIKISIPPTILVSVIGKIQDARRAVTMDVKRSGSVLFVLGETRRELGASEYLAMHGLIGKRVPRVDAKSALRRYRLLHEAISGGLVLAAHDCSDGGLGVCLAEMAFAGGYGMEVDLSLLKAEKGMNDTELLYSETPSRIVVEVDPSKERAFRELFGRDAVALGGTTNTQRFVVRSRYGKTIADVPLDELLAAWKATLDF
ncbi:MAG TPA: AIR synthase-related protein, partial [Deltaproteobacteria bacterium]|nr:AIR synthase-related protein [Deltaproteobacteria bacterium]